MSYLSRGSLFKAFGILKEAVAATPASDRAALHRALYWFALSALRLGRKDIAVKALGSARRLRRRGHAQALYFRHSNPYGMPRQATGADDDRLAFFSLQLGRYFRGAGRSSFATQAERSLVLATLDSAWSGLIASGALNGRDCAEKDALFRKHRLDYPWLIHAPSECPSLAVDFRRGKRLSASDRCSCGSGLSYGRCCGSPEPHPESIPGAI